MVTNCHVTRDAVTIRISGGGSLWAATEQYADVAHDLCFLHVPTWSGRPAELDARESLHVGQAVAAIGFRFRRWRSVDSVTVSADDRALVDAARHGPDGSTAPR